MWRPAGAKTLIVGLERYGQCRLVGKGDITHMMRELNANIT